jgi:hypothetical protein
MSRVRSALTAASLVVVSSLLLFAAVGVAAGGTKYKGKTSQGRSIAFTLSGGKVKGLKATIDDRCPDGHILQETITFPDMKVNSKGNFGGRFGPAGQTTALSAHIKGKKSTGSMSDTSLSKREHRLCHGSATFSIKAK